jgi:CTP synthase
MRLGRCEAIVKKDSKIAKLYAKYGSENQIHDSMVSERHRHRYEFNDTYADQIEKGGMILSGRSKTEGLVEFIELPSSVHPFYVATQGHPEYKSRPLSPHPIFLGFIEACKKGEK